MRRQINAYRLRDPGTLILDPGGNAAAANWVEASSTGAPAKAATGPAGALTELGIADAVQFEQKNPTAGSLIHGSWYLHNASGWNFGDANVQITMGVTWPDRLARWISGNATNLELLISSDAGAGAFTNYKGITMFNGTVTGTNFQGRAPTVWTGANMTMTGGTLDWTSIKNIRFRVYSNGAQERVWFQGLWINRRANPCVVVSLDDGNAEAVSAASVANACGIPLTLYVIPELVGASGAYLTEGQIATLAAAGNAVAGHSQFTWPDRLQTIGEAAMLAELRVIQEWLRARGYLWQHYAYPGGQFNGEIMRIMREAGFLSARSIRGQTYVAGPPEQWSAGGSYEGVKSSLAGVPDWYQLMASPLAVSQSLANAKAALDTAIARGESLIYYGHKIGAVADSVTWTTSDWTALMDYIALKVSQGLVDVMTIDQYYRAYTQPRRTFARAAA